MKLAEALLLRADLQKKISQLTSRITPVMIIQDGKTPQEDPIKLLAQLRKTTLDLKEQVVKINKTNILTMTSNGKPLMESLAQRDALKTLLAQLRIIRQSAQIHGHSYSNLKTTIKVTALQSEIDQIGRAFRELDTEIQGINWTTELIE